MSLSEVSQHTQQLWMEIAGGKALLSTAMVVGFPRRRCGPGALFFFCAGRAAQAAATNVQEDSRGVGTVFELCTPLGGPVLYGVSEYNIVYEVHVYMHK